MAKPDLGDKALEAGSIESRRGGAAEIVVDDQDLLPLPPQPAGAIRQSILESGRLAVLLNLTHCRLADINHRLAFALRREAVMAQGCDEGQRAPVAVRS